MKLKSVELVNALSAAFEQLNVLTQTSVNINQNIVKAEVGQFVLFAKYFDKINVEDPARPVDTMVFEFFKPLANTTAIAENATNAFMKSLRDDGYILDDQSWKFFKAAFDTAAFVDDYYFEVSKLLQDIAGVSDAPAKAFSKPTTADTFAVADDATINIGFGKFDPAYFSETHYYDFGKSLEDAFALGETHFVAVWKPFADSVNGFEDHVFIFTKKAKDDLFYVADALAVDFAKPLSDSYSVLEAHSLEPGKVLYDIVAGVGDQAFVFTKKVKEDIASATDRITTRGLGKALFDAPLLNETHFYDFGKPLTDSSLVLEAHSLEPGKVLFDTVTGIGDYVWLLTKKAPDNPVGAYDGVYTFSVGKPLADGGSATDAINTIYFDKALSDAPVATDAIDYFATTKQLTDSVFFTDDVDGAASILDDQEMQFTKITTDVGLVSESFYRQVDFVRAYLDTGYLSDDNVFAVGKGLNDVPVTSDSINMLTGKQIYDIPVASENLAYALARVRSDSALLGDAKIAAFIKALLDLASTADAGSLRSQGYADFTYFAEDFVGASRTF